MKAERIVVLGTSGSGKSTLAHALATRLAIPHIELDAIHWQADWTPLPRPLFRERVAAAIAPERWVLDGNYSAVRDLVWARATTLVWLNYPFPIVFMRLLRRTLRRALTRELLWGGNRESLRLAFLSRDSILWWMITTYRRRRREYPLLFAAPEHRHLDVITLTSPRAADAFLNQVGPPPG